MAVSKNDLILNAASWCWMTQEDCRRVVEEFLAVTENYLRMGNEIHLRGSFTLIPRKRAARKAFNPHTMERIITKPHRTVVAKFPKGYLDATHT